MVKAAKSSAPDATNELATTPPAKRLMVYPNPATDQITLKKEVTPHEDRQVIVTDAAGQILFTQLLLATESTALTHQVNIDQLPAGLYFVTLKVGTEEQTTRFIKMKE